MVKNFCMLQRKQNIGALLLFISSFGAQDIRAETYASYNYLVTTLPGVAFLLPSQIPSFCLIGEVCSNDAVWTQWDLPTLMVGEQVNIPTADLGSAFHLGSSLNGSYQVSLSPVYQFQSYTNLFDELTANIASRSSIFATTNDGMVTFDASAGNDYYLFIGGFARGGQSYQLQLTQVPLPPAFGMFGLGIIISFSRLYRLTHGTLKRIFSM